VTLAYLKGKDAESEEAQERANSSSLAPMHTKPFVPWTGVSQPLGVSTKTDASFEMPSGAALRASAIAASRSNARCNFFDLCKSHHARFRSLLRRCIRNYSRPWLPIPRFRACGRAAAAATRIVVRPVRAWNRSRKFGSSVHSEVWQLNHADPEGSPLLLRRAATESPNSTLLLAVA